MFPRRAKNKFFPSFFSLFVLLLHKIFALVLCQTQIIPVSLHAPQLDSNSSTFVGALEISNLKSVAPISRRDLFNNLIVILMRSDCERTDRPPNPGQHVCVCDITYCSTPHPNYSPFCCTPGLTDVPEQQRGGRFLASQWCFESSRPEKVRVIASWCQPRRRSLPNRRT
jgi:hypothetical protein